MTSEYEQKMPISLITDQLIVTRGRDVGTKKKKDTPTH